MDEKQRLYEDYQTAEKVLEKLKTKFPNDSVFKNLQPFGVLEVIHAFRECKKEEVAKRLIIENKKEGKNEIF